MESTPLSSPHSSRLDAPSTPDRDDPDMAPPASGSSSAGGSPIAWPSLDALAHRTYHPRKPVHARTVKTPELDEDASDISSPPSLTHSPNYGPTKARSNRKPAAAPPRVTTADLTSLLPRRRHNAPGQDGSDPFDLESSDEDAVDHDNDDDELSYVDARTAAARRRRRPAALAQSATNSSGKAKETTASAAGKGRKKVRTYGSRTSDKENEEGERDEEGDGAVGELGSEAEEEQAGGAAGEEGEQSPSPDSETSAMMEARMGLELKNAAKKFKEVDRWELSFEEVTESSSPMPDAR